MTEREVAATRIALLDEKRMLLATRALAAIDGVLALRRDYAVAWATALASLRRAYDRHGVHALELWPAGATRPQFDRDERARRDRSPVDPSPEALECAACFRALLELAGTRAARDAELWRIADEYRRTERRASAIEHVLLPELQRSITHVEQALEAVDQEEAIRVRMLGKRARAAV